MCLSLYRRSMRYLQSNGKSSLMIYDKFSHPKYRYGNRRFWSVGYYVSAVGLNEATGRKYIREQDREDIMFDKRRLRVKYMELESLKKERDADLRNSSRRP